MSKFVEKHREEAEAIPVKCAIIVTSSTLYEQMTLGIEPEDETGSLIERRLVEKGFDVIYRRIVPNEWDRIKGAILHAIYEARADVVITTGGTGLSATDMTVEVVESLLTKRMPGFGELFRFLSYQEIGAAAMLSRATAGLVDSTLIFALPGSAQAAQVALEKLILPELRHAVKQAKKGIIK
ncbi:MAG: molybdenum cofactor biosynthesis protein [Candidatus Methanomethylicota archaeon]|uniref:Molybdenum cofactor biosynthesis protein n=1 Tax=Thermoproteota archaeon TaxID=2056631 RepID=A0A497EQJ2_9CREN|nr:MAG: molybdenum cofactor biosynthesis protein [Candidatus Verstraetearchaeota archaeon]RLE53703.1 MAG: molybdenum cofactor biosynthesis protein [Candidatus Verstraetearchaeota archaeon]